MRLIDADALKQDLTKFYDNEVTARELIDAQPTINGCDWISVKDKLPELNQRVLVYAVGKIDGFIGEHTIEICKRFIQRIFPSSPGHEMWSGPYQYFHTDYKITHWIPLPEQPPERKTAHWVFGNTMGHSWMKCSECCVSQSGQTGCWTYCPNCGAEMKGETEVEID